MQIFLMVFAQFGECTSCPQCLFNFVIAQSPALRDRISPQFRHEQFSGELEELEFAKVWGCDECAYSNDQPICKWSSRMSGQCPFEEEWLI